MPPPNRLEPIEALHQVIVRLSRLEPQQFALHEAPPLYLAGAVEVEATLSSGERPIAVRNGIAVAADVKEGDVCRLLGLVSPSGTTAQDAAGEAGAKMAWRVETGGAQPVGFERLVRLEDAVIVGSGLARIDRILDSAAWTSPVFRTRFPAGARLDSRLRSTLERCRVATVSARPSFHVGLAVVGDEIIRAGSRSGAQGVEDVSLAWLAATVETLGLTPVLLGVRPDSPESLKDLILHLRGRVDVLLLVGGASDGVNDRTLEGLVRFDSRMIHFGLDLEGASSFLQAKALGMDVFAMGGKPLETAALWDLIVGPALLARLGASPGLWDWTRRRYPFELPADGNFPGVRSGTIHPAALAAGVDGNVLVRGLSRDAVSPFLPSVPGQEGWLILPSLQAGGSLSGSVAGHFQPLCPGARSA